MDKKESIKYVQEIINTNKLKVIDSSYFEGSSTLRIFLEKIHTPSHIAGVTISLCWEVLEIHVYLENKETSVGDIIKYSNLEMYDKNHWKIVKNILRQGKQRIEKSMLNLEKIMLKD